VDHDGVIARAPRLLLTGAGGQLARSLAPAARRRGWSVEALAREELDIADPAQVSRVLECSRPEIVVNCAGFTRVDLCEERREEAQRANAVGPGVLARACRDRALLVQVSTEYVFAGRTPTPIPEEADPEPLSEYGRSKLAGERAARSEGGDCLIARTQWLFGPGPNFVRTILAAAREGRALRVVEDQVGRPTWTGALAEAILDALEAGARGTLHLACEGLASWYDLAVDAVEEGVRRGWNPEVRVEAISSAEMPRPATRPAHAVLGLERARKLEIELPHWRAALRAWLDAEEERSDA
jgi:dTDP-4-dehydrorhamnose reductase